MLRVQRQSLWCSGEKLEVQSGTTLWSEWRGGVDGVPILVDRSVAIQLEVEWGGSKHGATVPSGSQNDSGNVVHQANVSCRLASDRRKPGEMSEANPMTCPESGCRARSGRSR